MEKPVERKDYTMSETLPSSIALFNQFQPKYREISWGLLGFGNGRPGFNDASSYLYFRPSRNGESIRGYSWHEHPYIDVREAALFFESTFDPAENGSPLEQMTQAAWKEVLEEPFTNRAFFADPADGVMSHVFSTEIPRFRNIDIPIVFSYTGEPIPGLYLPTNMKAHHWSLFFPEDAPEVQAITAARELEYIDMEQREAESQKEEAPGPDEIRKKLDEALRTIAA